VAVRAFLLKKEIENEKADLRHIQAGLACKHAYMSAMAG